MPGDVETIPQLPPIPPQTPFGAGADRYPWERHYPVSSWSTSVIPTESGRSKSTSPVTRLRALAVPSLPSSSTLGEIVIPPPRSQSRSHSHSRSGSRVLVLASASTAEPIVISPPARTHSRSVSAAMSKLPPTPRASPAEPAVRPYTRTKSRPLPLPLPPKDPLQHGDRALVRTESLPLPRLTPASAPAAAHPARHHTTPLSEQPEEVAPLSAPPRRAGPSHSHVHSRAMLVTITQQTHVPQLPLKEPPPIPASAPVRAPTPPRPKPRPAGLPATPRRQDDNRGSERGRSTEPAPVTIRASPVRGLEPAPSTWAKQHNDEYARKWVLEKKGKRLTQDSMVVAQQLRLLR